MNLFLFNSLSMNRILTAEKTSDHTKLTRAVNIICYPSPGQISEYFNGNIISKYGS